MYQMSKTVVYPFCQQELNNGSVRPANIVWCHADCVQSDHRTMIGDVYLMKGADLKGFH